VQRRDCSLSDARVVQKPGQRASWFGAFSALAIGGDHADQRELAGLDGLKLLAQLIQAAQQDRVHRVVLPAHQVRHLLERNPNAPVQKHLPEPCLVLLAVHPVAVPAPDGRTHQAQPVIVQ
jgi:hypothetical protein